MVNYNDFKDYMRQRAEEEIGGRATVNTVRKLNGVILDGLNIMSLDSNISPTIYLNGYYEEFKNLKESEDDALDIIWKSIKDFYNRHLPKTDFNTDSFMKWEYVRNRLEIRLINTEQNKDFLSDTINIPFMDLSIIFAVKVGIVNGARGAVVVKDTHADIWGVTAEEMYSVAIENTADDWEIIPICKLINSLRGEELFYEGEHGFNMYVLSNKDQQYGAAAVLNKEAMEEIGRIMGSKEIYVIPSSIHELILVPVCDEGMGAENINDMIREVNSATLDKTDILSDHVYTYNVREKRLIA